MKANRKFVEGNEEGVSAVIGVILMVAITVAIAATVYVYVSGMIGGTAEKTPTIALTPDSAYDKITVASAGIELAWTDFKIQASEDCNGTHSDAGNQTVIAITTSGQVIGTEIWNDTTAGHWDDTSVDAGDSITLSGVSGNIKITFVYIPTNSIAGSVTVNV